MPVLSSCGVETAITYLFFLKYLSIYASLHMNYLTVVNPAKQCAPHSTNFYVIPPYYRTVWECLTLIKSHIWFSLMLMSVTTDVAEPSFITSAIDEPVKWADVLLTVDVE